ncbi:hypothetical protein Bbelb_290690 [Branchiostoma belcheri]|nr:hypothetical protein Bbelb_290690 [Branchiostoma belcheri]
MCELPAINATSAGRCSRPIPRRAETCNFLAVADQPVGRTPTIPENRALFTQQNPVVIAATKNNFKQITTTGTRKLSDIARGTWTDKKSAAMLFGGGLISLVIGGTGATGGLCPVTVHPCLLVDLCNIELKFFPPNTTSRLQPMDHGITVKLNKILTVLQEDRVNRSRHRQEADGAGRHPVDR